MKLIKDLGMDKNKIAYRVGIYECSYCKKHFKTNMYDVKRNNTQRCADCRRKTHGKSRSKVYNAWLAMIRRCKKDSRDHKHYADRGITVCERWGVFENFYLDMGEPPSVFHSVDRIDNDGNYELNNCRWSTNEVQRRNTVRLRKDNTSGFRGVTKHKRTKKWHAQISVYGKRKHLGDYDYPWTAGMAYDAYVLKHNLEHTRNYQC